MDFEAILKYFRVSMPKKYLDEDEYKKLITSALSFRVFLRLKFNLFYFLYKLILRCAFGTNF